MKILSVINEKGGVGKTFVTTQLGYFCRYKLGNRVLVVDLDQQNNTGEILSQSGLCSLNPASSGQILRDGESISIRQVLIPVVPMS